MKVLIIEDEEPAAKRLHKMLKEIEPGFNILDNIVSVSSAIKWFNENESPDLVFSDIQLSDGLSFEIFKTVNLTSPIIFTTAYDQYAIEAFKVNSIDYLLKPIKKDELANAVNKFKKIFASAAPPAFDINKLLQSINPGAPEYKKRFVVRYGEHIKTIDITQVSYFYTEEKINFLKTKDNYSYPIDYNLDKLETMLDPERFFRINRQFIISIDSIGEMFSFSKSRVKINLKPPINLDTIVSTERSPHFKVWLSGKE